jgi:hypothetical protein
MSSSGKPGTRTYKTAASKRQMGGRGLLWRVTPRPVLWKDGQGSAGAVLVVRCRDFALVMNSRERRCNRRAEAAPWLANLLASWAKRVTALRNGEWSPGRSNNLGLWDWWDFGQGKKIWSLQLGTEHGDVLTDDLMGESCWARGRGHFCLRHKEAESVLLNVRQRLGFFAISSPVCRQTEAKYP